MERSKGNLDSEVLSSSSGSPISPNTSSKNDIIWQWYISVDARIQSNRLVSSENGFSCSIALSNVFG